jgi:hypothetical protein
MPPATYSLWLPASANGNPDQPENQERNGEAVAVQIPLPGLVFAGAGLHYYLWAVKAKEFSPVLPAYHAPLPNIYPDGRICWGSNQVEAVTAQNVVATWKLFITSPFNTHLVQGKSKQYPENILLQLAKLGITWRKTYPTSDLLPLKNGGERQGWTIDRLVERLIAASGRPDL